MALYAKEIELTGNADRSIAKLERCKFGFENLLTSTRGHFNQSWIKWPRPTRAKKLGFARLDAITIEDIGIDMTEKNLAPPRVKFEAPNS